MTNENDGILEEAEELLADDLRMCNLRAKDTVKKLIHTVRRLNRELEGLRGIKPNRFIRTDGSQ